MPLIETLQPQEEKMSEDEIDVDVCMRCGRYFGWTQSIIDCWERIKKTQRVMPQYCFGCLKEEFGDYEIQNQAWDHP